MSPTASPVRGDTRTRLIEAAVRLFQEQGFHGTSLADILTRADASKSSLFHFFPNGKSDLAQAAAQWADLGMLALIDASFAGADDVRGGCDALCRKIAKLMDKGVLAAGCPVSQILVHDSNDGQQLGEASRIYNGWSGRVAQHARRLGMEAQPSDELGEALLVGLQGAWTVARVRQDSEVVRDLMCKLGAIAEC